MKIPAQLPQSIWLDSPTLDLPANFLNTLAFPDLVKKLLWRQGIRTLEEAQGYLNFTQYAAASPYDLPNMQKAVERTMRAINQQELIGIWGDFDVDGQTSTAILLSSLREAGAKVVYHVPIRRNESHGIKLDVLKQFVRQGIRLIITCDTGISDHESITWAMQNGIDVIITDHHTLPQIIPQAFAIINPQFLDENHPLRPLPGAGTAYQFSKALLDSQNKVLFAQELHDLAALGIVADIAELRQDCRFLTQSGINLIKTNPRPSLRAMLKAAEINPAEFNEESIAYSLAPRLNAAGRLADANPLVEFLISNDPTLISVTVNQLEGLNARRKLRCDQVFQGAIALIERNPDLLNHQVLMISHPEWEAGVVGIVASRLVSIFNKPVILFVAPEGGLMRGSARSVAGVNITAGIRQQAANLASFGGHPMAAGLSLPPENFTQFQRNMDQFVQEEIQNNPICKTIQIDAWQDPSSLNLEILAEIDRLAPFGSGNPSPVYAAKSMRVVSSSPVGKTKDHVQLVVENNTGQTSKLIWWQGAGLPQPESTFDLAYTAHSSNWKGKPQIQLEWVDYRLSKQDKIVLNTRNTPLTHQDFRTASFQNSVLNSLIDQFHPALFQEGDFAENSQVGQSRLELVQNDTLAIISIPPSQAHLDKIIKTVNPIHILWFALIPSENNAEPFLRTAAAWIKNRIESGKCVFDIESLAAKLASTEKAANLACRWFASKGQIQLVKQEENIFEFLPGGTPDSHLEKELREQLKKEIIEIQSFRRFYQKCEIQMLLERGN